MAAGERGGDGFIDVLVYNECYEYGKSLEDKMDRVHPQFIDKN